jgi:hypothetical protein
MGKKGCGDRVEDDSQWGGGQLAGKKGGYRQGRGRPVGKKSGGGIWRPMSVVSSRREKGEYV